MTDIAYTVVVSDESTDTEVIEVGVLLPLPVPATMVSFDTTGTDLVSEDVQLALAELAQRIYDLENPV